MNTRVKNYTLDCGCFFEHKPQPGVESCYVLSSACPEHGTTRPVLSSPAPVNHDPFVGETATQRRDRDWILALKHAMDTNGIKGATTYVVVTPDPHAAQRWLSEVIAVAVQPYLGKESTPVTQCVNGPDISQFAKPTEYKAGVIAEAFKYGAMLDELPHLEHTQPLPPLHMRDGMLTIQTGDKPLYIHVRNPHGGYKFQCVDCGADKGIGHNRFCKFHAPAMV